MISISNKRIPEKKRVPIALTYVFGIGRSLALKIAKKTKTEEKKVFELTTKEIDDLIKECENLSLENKLREEIQKHKDEKIRLGTYHGKRLEKGLPIHGQSTRHNARTAKRNRPNTKKIIPKAKGKVLTTGKKNAPTSKKKNKK